MQIIYLGNEARKIGKREREGKAIVKESFNNQSLLWATELNPTEEILGVSVCVVGETFTNFYWSFVEGISYW